MVVSLLQKLLYPPPASVVVTAMSVVSFVFLGNGGWMEFKGKNMQYSKLIDEKKKKKKAAKVPSKIGMLGVYIPPFLAGVASFFVFPNGDFRFNLVRAAVTTHFFKRVLEVLFVHKYSGSMDVEAMIPISLSYLLCSATMIYNQHLINQTLIPEPLIDLKYIGIPIFLMGICSNFYHHYLLSELRADQGDNKKYKIPKGGFFSLVICPHYLFEIMGFLGISCISQTPYAICYTMGTTFYLMGRSYATRRWYRSKFEDFPNEVKALIPYIF